MSGLACSCCGNPVDPAHLDARFELPDAVMELPAEQRRDRTWGGDYLLQVQGVGAFVRCLLRVELSHESSVTFGTWLSVHPDDLRRAHQLWDDPRYAELTLEGYLGNAIEPWGQAIYRAPARAVVRNVAHVPYLVESADPDLARVISQAWDRDEVLGSMQHALPVTIRRPLTEHWSIDRSAGLTAVIVDGALEFRGPGRVVLAEAWSTVPGTTSEDSLASMLHSAPSQPVGHIIEPGEGAVRRGAYWLPVTEPGSAGQRLHGFVAHQEEVLRVTCVYDEPSDLAWAMSVWRSVRYAR
jgi:hypothetical protein